MKLLAKMLIKEGLAKELVKEGLTEKGRAEEGL